MPTTLTFYVDSKTKEIKPVKTNPSFYFRKESEFEGQADVIIEVFAIDNHLKHAEYLRHALHMANLGKRYYHVKIEVKG